MLKLLIMLSDKRGIINMDMSFFKSHVEVDDVKNDIKYYFN